MKEFEIFELKNGIRVIFKPTLSEAAHCGLLINAGTRDEQEHEQGLAHYIEHTLFKGTSKRKFYHILSRIDSVGGELNAYTSKEETCIYASFQNQYLERAIELIADITFNSNFPAKEIEKEKLVIIDEISSYQDSPSEQIFDDFEEHIFSNHPLGRNILGTEESVRSFSRKHILNFIKTHYTNKNMVLCIAGNFDLKKVQYLAQKYIEPIVHKGDPIIRKKPAAYKPFYHQIKKNTHQSHCCMGTRAYATNSKQKLGLVLLNNLLGGSAMNTRLNLNIKEKYGFTYNLDSSYAAYSDTGIFNIYLGTDKNYLDKTIALILKELKKLRDTKLGVLQLEGAKRQLCGNIALAQDNNASVILALGKSLLYFNKVDELDELYTKINKLNASEILAIANEIFEEKKLSYLIFD